MASRRALESSVIIEDHFSFPQSIPEKSILTTSTPFKLSNLIIKDNEFAWKGSLESLKSFVRSDLKIEGKWSSPGSDVKQFVSEDYTLKWYGKRKQKLVIIRDDVTESLRDKLDKFAMLNRVNDRDGEQYSEAEGDLNLGEVTAKSLLDDDIHEPSPSISQNKEDKDMSLAENGHIFKNSECHCNVLSIQLKRIEGDLQQLKCTVEASNMNENTQLCKTSACQSERAFLTNKLEEANKTINDLRTKIMNLEQEKDSLITALKLQQKDYQVCLDLHKQNKSTESPCNQQIAQENSKRKQHKEVNSSNSNLFNTENRFQALSDVLDNQTETETMTKNHQKENEGKIMDDQNECTAPIQDRQQNPKQQNRHNHKIGSDIIVIGDSLIKNIQPRKLTKKNVHKYTFPGKTADEIENEINLDNSKAIPSHVIIHAGTNNLPTESATVCANKIERLAVKVKNQFPYSKIGLSGLTVRHDIDVSKKIEDANKELGLICAKLNISFIDNSTIDDTCLNKSRLHLNAKGSAILAVHFITFLRGDRASLTPRKQRHEDFQQSAIQKLGELLKMIATPDKNIRRRKYYPT